MQAKVEGQTNSLLSKLLHHYGTDYNSKALFPALEAITLNLQSISTIYKNFPKTSIQLLTQVKLPFDKLEYLQNVSNPIRFFGVKNQNPSFFQLAKNLEYLRTLLSQEEQALNNLFAKEIELMPGNDKKETFARIVSEACTKAIDMTIAEIQAQMDAPQKGKDTVLTVF